MLISDFVVDETLLRAELKSVSTASGGTVCDNFWDTGSMCGGFSWWEQLCQGTYVHMAGIRCTLNIEDFAGLINKASIYVVM